MNEIAAPPLAEVTRNDTPSPGRRMLNKVPEITVYFWLIKVLCTTVGETFADNLNENLGLGLTNTSYLMGALLIAMLVFQFRARRYVPGIYWLAVVLISVVGTLVSDNLVENYGVTLETTTIAFSAILICVFASWYAVERTLSVHTIFTTRREALLLAGDPLHLRSRHLRRRLPLRAARTRLPRRPRDLRRGDRRRRGSALRPADERDPLLLARLHPHPAARRLDRRLPRLADRRRRPRSRHQPDQHHLPLDDPRAGRLPGDLQAGRDPLRADRDRPRPIRGRKSGGPGRAQQGRGDRVAARGGATTGGGGRGTLLRPGAEPGPPRLRSQQPGREERRGAVGEGAAAARRAGGATVAGRVANSPNAYDDIVEELEARAYGEIILETPPAHISHWLHVDLPQRISELGYPTETVAAVTA